MTHALERLLSALDSGSGFDDVDDEALLWAALHAAGVTAAWREAVRAAGGPAAVLARGVLPAFAVPWRRRRLLDLQGIGQRVQRLLPFLSGGGRVVGDAGELRRCHDEPVLCFYGAGDGRIPAPTTPTVAIVGSREASIRYVERAAMVAGALAAAGVVVVSGGARGVDRAAQRAARLARGAVVVVAGELPTRIPDDVVADRELCWLSPHAPWDHVSKHHFVARNTWIAALADVVIVVCGGETSGTQHTVEAAVRLGRPVATLAVDDAGDLMSAVPKALLEHGVGHEIADDVDVDALLRLQPRPGAREAWAAHFARKKGRVVRRRDVPLPLPLMAPAHDALAFADDGAPPLLRLLRRHGGELLIDEAAARLQTSMRELLVDAAALEMNGTLRREGALLCLVDGA
jgi:predicted Rossmann fold nucleotide-binding protein DprA/Smf involved in DNA uptake